MAIQRLPQYLINKLKAGEIVERPSSVVKELIENSLDAGATEIFLDIQDGGKILIKLEDNGNGIDIQDLPMTIERYATSKISNEDDLYNISTYGFRGEALASISEISKFKIQTKISKNKIGYELAKIGSEIISKEIPFHKDHGTIMYVENIFFNTPVREKFLKSAQTEWGYIYDLFLDFAIINYNKKFTISKNGKIFLDLNPDSDLLQRLLNIFKPEWKKNLKLVENKTKDFDIRGVISDPALTFGGVENIKIFVNKRPVNDKIIKKALLEAYERQISPNTYPLAVIFFDIDPKLVDVNVHPRKLEIKFIDPGTVFNFVKQSIQQSFGYDKISGGNIYSSKPFSQNQQFRKNIDFWGNQNLVKSEINIGNSNLFENQSSIESKELQINDIKYKILGQIWNSYIVLESQDGICFVDQHAVAERIMFDQIKKEIQKNQSKSEILLSPITVSISKNIDLDAKIADLNKLGFDVSKFGENKIIIYSVPNILNTYKIDFDILFNKILYLKENLNFNIVLDSIFASHACKVSIKAGQKLSFVEMENLIKDAFGQIEGFFVCQHGRPSIVNVSKEDIEKLFDR